jgi:uncharacterized membrane protein YraQ (UPF0718 family)
MVILITSLALCLIAILDIRRAFLFVHSGPYLLKTVYFSLHPLQLLLFLIGFLGLSISYRNLGSFEAAIGPRQLSDDTRKLAFALFALIVLDLFSYRGVAAARAAAAGKLGSDWLNAFGVSGAWRPLALAASYQLVVWHAMFLAILLGGLSFVLVPRYMQAFISERGARGSLQGVSYGLLQPFCSCCAAVIAPSLRQWGASREFLLSFVVTSPALNITTVILTVLLLPAPYAAARVLGGVVLAVLVTYLVAQMAGRPELSRPRSPLVMSGPRVPKWVRSYFQLLFPDSLIPEATPSHFLRAWSIATLRIGLVMAPTFFVFSALTGILLQVLPSAFGNNGPSVILASMSGSLLMIATWSEIPVALQMINAGLYGPAAALLIVLPSVSLPSLLLLAGSMGRAREGILLAFATVVVGIVVGLIFL